MKKNKLRLLLLSAVLTGTALVSTAHQAVACGHGCFIVDADTACCWFNCELVCG